MDAETYGRDPRLARAWAELPRNEHGLVVFNAPGIGDRLTNLLDRLEPLAEQPTLLDGISNHFLRLARSAGLTPGPKVDADKFNVTSDFKLSVQAGVSTAQAMRAYRSGAETGLRIRNGSRGPDDDQAAQIWPEPLLEVFDLLEDVRRFMYLLLVNSISDPWWSEKRQSIRATRYFPGLHAPQAPHLDPPVMVMVLLPPGDQNLMVNVEGQGWATMRAGPDPTVVAFPGNAASHVIPGAEALEHAVSPFKGRKCRDVATLFVG